MPDKQFRNENGQLVQYDENGNEEPVSTKALATDESDTNVAARMTQYYNPRTYLGSVFPNIDTLGNSTTEIVDLGNSTGFGRLWYLHANTSVAEHYLYVDADNGDIDLYTSDDGKSWSAYGSNPVATGYDRNFQVIKVGDTFHAFYGGKDSTPIQHITSDGSDGTSWSASGTSILSTSSSGWDQSSMRYPGVVHYEGQWWLYYMGEDSGETWRIGLATSNDPGTAFTKHPANPILEPSDSGGVDDVHVFDPHPVVIGDTIFLAYTGGGSANLEGSQIMDESCCLATSRDGVNFEKYSNNPIVAQQGHGQDETLNPNFVVIGDTLYTYAASRNDAQDDYRLFRTSASLEVGV